MAEKITQKKKHRQYAFFAMNMAKKRKNLCLICLNEEYSLRMTLAAALRRGAAALLDGAGGARFSLQKKIA